MTREEAAEKFVYDWAGLSPTERRIAERAYLAGAEWQKERDDRDLLMSDNRHFEKVYELGKKDMREEMMKDAVEANGVICKLSDRVWISPVDEENFHQEVYDRFVVGQTVKIVIVPDKED